MTTTPIAGITDELLAEIEEYYGSVNGGSVEVLSFDGCNKVSNIAAELRRLRAEVEALRVDSCRYRWLLENADMMHWENMLHFSDMDGIESVSAFIDTAMKSSTEGSK